MRFIHHVALHVDAERRRELSEIGIQVDEGFQAFDVDESEPMWPDVQRWIARHQAVDMVRTETTADERAAATWLCMGAWHHGYPMPDDDFGYREMTFDLTDYCPRCGIGAVQKAPFRMRAEPKWGRRTILQLNWEFDTYFVTPGLWKAIFEPRGVPALQVLRHKTGQPLTTVVQLVIDSIASTRVQLGDHALHWCEQCERPKYLPFVRGCFPSFDGPPGTAGLFKSQEYFGSGASADRMVIADRDLYRTMTAAGVRGCQFLPVCSAP